MINSTGCGSFHQRPGGSRCKNLHFTCNMDYYQSSHDTGARAAFPDSKVDWFNHYFLNRTQAVKANSSISEFKTVRCGVPQGSVLGPLMFLVYVNDLPNLPLESNILMYVVAIFNSGPSENQVLEKLSRDMALIAN